MTCPLCATLRAERDEALEQVRQLKVHAFGGADELARLVAQCGLTRNEALFAVVLLRHDVARREVVMDALYWDDPDCARNGSSIPVLAWKVRRKLSGLGIAVSNVRSIGWRMDAASKGKLRAAAGLAP